MPRSLVERAEFLEKRIREKGPIYFKVMISPVLRLELDALRGEQSLSSYVMEMIIVHSTYLYDSDVRSLSRPLGFNDDFERAYAYEKRLKISGQITLKVRIDPDLRIDLEIQRDDLSVSEFLRVIMAKHCAYYGDEILQQNLRLVDYLNMSADKDLQRKRRPRNYGDLEGVFIKQRLSDN